MTEPRYDWTIDEVLAVIERPFHDLLAAAHACHRERFDPHEIEGAKLLSIKTGACPEDCAYCPQSARNETDLQPEPLMDLPDILAKAGEAKAEGAGRFCMGRRGVRRTTGRSTRLRRQSTRSPIWVWRPA